MTIVQELVDRHGVNPEALDEVCLLIIQCTDNSMHNNL